MSDEIRNIASTRTINWETATDEELDPGYREMAADKEAEAEALEWIEGTIGGIGDEEWVD